MQTRWMVVLLATMACAGATADDRPAPLDDRMVSLDANCLTLTQVLGEIATQAGVGLIARGTDTSRVTLSLSGVAFGACVTGLSDMFSLVSIAQGNVLTVQTIDEAVGEADRQLAQGRADSLQMLLSVVQGEVAMYGSEELKGKFATSLAGLIHDRAAEAIKGTPPQPLMARALSELAYEDARVRPALQHAAVKGHIALGQPEAAAELWQEMMRGGAAPEVMWAWGEVFAALHHAGSEQAGAFWNSTFDCFAATAVLQEGWRRKQYQDALRFGRINVDYAIAAGRPQEARRLETAIEACLNSTRVVELACAVDREATADPDCEEKVRARVQGLSQVYEQAFGIRFELAELLLWDPPADSSFTRQYAALKGAVGDREPELTVGFILEVFEVHPADFRPPDRAHLWTGYGCPHVGAFLLTRDFAFEYVTDVSVQEWSLSAQHVVETLVHEMGHMFGALHVEDQASVMRPSSRDDPTFEFDDLNRQVILHQKWKSFEGGLESMDEPELLALAADYGKHEQISQVPNGSVEEQARVRLALAKLYRERGLEQLAQEQARIILEIGMPDSVVGEARGMLAG